MKTEIKARGIDRIMIDDDRITVITDYETGYQKGISTYVGSKAAGELAIAMLDNVALEDMNALLCRINEAFHNRIADELAKQDAIMESIKDAGLNNEGEGNA